MQTKAASGPGDPRFRFFAAQCERVGRNLAANRELDRAMWTGIHCTGHSRDDRVP